MTNTQRCNIVAAELVSLGYKAETENTGGNVMCVVITDDRFPGEPWLVGMGGDTWMGERVEEGTGYPVEDTVIESGVSSETSDPAQLRKVAHDLAALLRNI